MIALANAAKRAEVANGTAPPNPSLSEPETADVESFLRDMLLIFPLLEVNAFQVSGTHSTTTKDASPSPAPDLAEASLHLSGPSAVGSGADTPEGFIVKAGSKARAATVPSIHKWLVDLRETLLSQGILSPQSDQLIFTQDYAFDSPSSAAGVPLGRAANGRTEWKTAKGQTLKDLQTASVGDQSD